MAMNESIDLRSDTVTRPSPAMRRAMAEAEVGDDVYGDDDYTAQLTEVIKNHFGEMAEVFPTFNGTGTNVIALQSILERWEAVVCAETAHIHADEGGAPEKMAGIKLWTVPTEDGKLTPELVERQLFDIGSVHRAQVGAISITQVTEMGTVYSAEEIQALADVAHSNGIHLHMDGARLANAAVTLGQEFREFTTDAGVDILSFGGTKNGTMAAEG